MKENTIKIKCETEGFKEATEQPRPTLNEIVEDMEANDIPVKAEETIPECVPKALADLMRARQLSVDDIRRVVAARGYFPEDTPFENYPKDFVNGCLIGAFEQLYDFAVKQGLINLPF